MRFSIIAALSLLAISTSALPHGARFNGEEVAAVPRYYQYRRAGEKWKTFDGPKIKFPQPGERGANRAGAPGPAPGVHETHMRYKQEPNGKITAYNTHGRLLIRYHSLLLFSHAPDSAETRAAGTPNGLVVARIYSIHPYHISHTTMTTPTARTGRTAVSNQEGTKTARQTRGAALKEGNTLIVEQLQQIKNAEEGRVYLESSRLLLPAGMPLTNAMIAACLHQISMISTMTPPVLNAIRAVAFLMEELETTTYHEGFNTELDNFTSGMGEIVTHTKAAVNDRLAEIAQETSKLIHAVKTQLAELAQETSRLIHATQNTSPTTHGATQPGTTHHGLPPAPSQQSYSQVLSQPPKEVDPRMLARHNIRRRQIMLEGVEKDSELGTMGDKEIRETINRKLEELADDRVRVRAATRQRNGGILLEMDSDFGSAWIKTQANTDSLCAAIGKNVTTRKRTHNLIVKFAPLTAEPEKETFWQEVCEANNMEEGTITSMRWLKPAHRRTKTQTCGHISLKVTDVTEANRLITLGIIMLNRRLTVEKCKIDPIRCLKCQGYNHYAKECITKEDICGQCGDRGHRTSACNNTTKTHCVSCNADDHPSYDRHCPTFLKKQADKNDNTPENNLPFIQTDEPWTWNTRRTLRPTNSDGTNAPDRSHLTPPITLKEGSQKERTRLHQRQHQHQKEKEPTNQNRTPTQQEPPPDDENSPWGQVNLDQAHLTPFSFL